jgi:CheY-like chemotaxis protein
MDHMMPEMDGFEAVQIIRNEIGTEYAKTVPIIALTANAIVGNEALFLKNGFQAFLSKPIDIMSLDAVINRYVRNKALEKELSPTAPEFQSPTAESQPGTGIFEGKSLGDINFSIGLRRFDNDEETYLQLLKSYLALIQSTPEKIRTYTEETHSTYILTVHSLKSTSYTVGASRIGSKAEELEAAAQAKDSEFIRMHNSELIGILESLIPKLENFLEEIRGKNPKQVRQQPDPALLHKVFEACLAYDIENLDAAMAELEQYAYESQSELIEWLREQIDRSEFEKIKERLEDIQKQPEDTV